MKDPQTYLRQLAISLPCPVHPDKEAVLDPKHRAFVNHEGYFFSSEEALALFIKDPLPYCGLLTDPVSQVRFQATKSSPRFEYKGRPYYFTTAASLATFKSAPEMYATPKRVMKKEPAVPSTQPSTQPSTPASQPTSAAPN